MLLRSSSASTKNSKLLLLIGFSAALGALYTACGDPPATSNTSGPSTTSGPGGTGGAGGAGSGTAGGMQGGGGTGGALPCDPANAVCPCTLSVDCGGGSQLCLNGICIEPCDFSYQCGSGNVVCVNGQCADKCDPQLPCPEAGYKCSKGVCVPDPQNPQCSMDKPCADGTLVCAGGLCTSPCTQNSDCPAGDVCNWNTGTCMADPSIQPACSMDAECQSAQPQKCAGLGFCYFVCDPASPTADMFCKSIDSRLIKCDQGLCKTQEELSPQCTTQKPCPIGQDCINNKCL